MSVREFPSAVITRFRGAAQLREPDDNAEGALTAKNVAFGPDYVDIRPAIGVAFTPASPTGLAVQSFFNWVQADWNRLVMFSINAGAPKVRQRRMDLATESDIVTGIDADTVDAVFAAYGSRLIMAFLDAQGNGEDQGRIWNSTAVDKLFQAPLLETTDFTITASEPGSGVVEAGNHRVGCVFRTRNGYDTKPVVKSATVVATGGMSLRLTLAPTSTWPAWTDTVRIIMTPTSNEAAFYFVPGSENIGYVTVAVPPGTSFSVIADIDVNDTVLNQGDEATEYFGLISQASGGTGPWNPKFVGTYGNRVVYLADVVDFTALGNVTVAYFSEPALPEWITADQHGVTVPSRRPLVGGFQMGSLYFLYGPSWTFSVFDNQDVPATWDAAALASGQIGSRSVHGVDVDTHSGIAWVAHDSGLYPFNGRYPEHPVSYDQGAADWDRINWAPANRVVVVVNAQAQEVRVYAPLDASNNISHVLVFSYTNSPTGVPSHLDVDYALYDYDPATNIGFAGRVLNPSVPIEEIWMSLASTGPIYRDRSDRAGDADLYHDADDDPIDQQYTTGPTPAVFPAPVAHKGAHIAIRGAGDCAVTVYSHHQARSQALADITLAANPGREALRLCNVQSEALHWGFTNKNTADSRFKLSRIKSYFMGWVAQR